MSIKAFFKILIFIILPFYAYSSTNNNLIVECQITPQIWTLTSTPQIQKSNNLRRFVGSSEFASGQFIFLSGVIMDEECVPVSDAIVEIWQANSLGGLDYLSKKSDKNDPYFLGTGTAITNNLGQYNFATLMPGPIDKARAPHINIRIRHQNFVLFETIVYFENNHRTSNDPILLNEVPKSLRALLIAELSKFDNNKKEPTYIFNITLEGINKYTSY